MVKFDWARSDRRKQAKYPQMDVYLGACHVYEGCRLTIEGATGDGKSMLGLGMALAIARRDNFLHLPKAEKPVPGDVNVLYMDYEMGRVEVQNRLATFGTHPNFWVVCFDDPELGEEGLRPIDTDDGEMQLISLINALEIRVVFLDNLYSAVEGSIVGGKGDGQAHERVVPLLRKLSKFNVATVLLAHTNATGDLYGDKRLTWQLTGRIRLTRIRPSDEQLKGKKASVAEESVLRATIEERKIRGGALKPPFQAVLRDGTWTIEDEPKAKLRASKVNESRIQFAFSCLAELEPVGRDKIPFDVLEGMPRGREAYDREEFRLLFYAKLDGSMSQGTKRQSFHRTITLLVDRRLIGQGGGLVWLLAE